MDYLNIRPITIAILVGFWGVALGPAYAQDKGPSPRRNPVLFELQESQITGELGNVLGSLKLMETEIVGTVERPRLGFFLPWRDPDPMLLKEGEVQGGFLEEIYAPVDKESYSREIRIEGNQSTP